MHVSRPQLLARLGANNLSKSEDQLSRLRPLIGKAFQIEGHGQVRFYTEDDANRIYAYAAMCERYGTAKVRKCEVAYWLASEGFDVPGALVAEHIEQSIAWYARHLLRLASRRTSGATPLSGTSVNGLHPV